MGRPKKEGGHTKKRVSINQRCLKLIRVSDIDSFSRYVEGLIINDLEPARVETSFQEHIELLKQRGWGIRYQGTIDVWRDV